MTHRPPQDPDPVVKSGRMKQLLIVVAALFGVLLLAGACEEILDDVFDLDLGPPGFDLFD